MSGLRLYGLCLGSGFVVFWANSQNCEKRLLTSLYLSVCLSLYIRLSVHMELVDSHWMDFHEIWYWRFFENLSRKFEIYYRNLTRIMDILHKTYVHLWSLYLEWDMLQTKVVEKIKTHILCSVTLSWISGQLIYDMIWYDLTWYMIWYDTIWYIFINCNWVNTRWQ